MTIHTEFEFTLPNGYIDSNGNIHKNGVMRRATAADEILAAGDMRARANPHYAMVLILTRVLSKLGTLESITPNIVEGLYVGDFKLLSSLYDKINGVENGKVPATCPNCANKFEIDLGHSQ